MARKIPPSRRNGFSLLEMMVVLLIMGLAVGAVLLSLPSQNSKLRREAEGFAAKVVAARDEAVLTGSAVALTVNERGYYFERRADGRWQGYDSGPLAINYWSQGTSAVRSQAGGGTADQNIAGQSAAGKERLVFDPVGLASNALDLRLQASDASISVAVTRTGEVSIK